MTAYTFVSKASVASVNWNDPAIWSGGVVPNALDADVSFPATSSGTTTPYTPIVNVNSGDTFSVRSVDLHTGLIIDGTLNASTFTVHAYGNVHGFGNIAASIMNNGTITADIFDQRILHLTGTITGGGTLEIGAPILSPIYEQPQRVVYAAGIELSGPADQMVVFDGIAGTLRLDNPSSFTGSIKPYNSGDQILLEGVGLNDIVGKSYVGDHQGGTLTLRESSGSISLKFVGDYSATDFALSAGPQALSTDPASVYITVQPAPNAGSLLFYSSSQYTTWYASTDGSFHPSGLAPSLPPVSTPIAQADLNGDGVNEILLSNDHYSSISVLQFSNGAYASAAGFTAIGGAGWSVVGVGDFNGDHKADLLWRNGADTSIWTSQGTSFNNQAYYDRSVPGDWHVAGTGDINADGKADIVWRNENGYLSIWTSTGSDFDRNFYQVVEGRDWHIEGVGDFNGDGKADLLWRNDNGATNIWAATDHNFDKNFFGTTVDNDWQIMKTADINGDGMADILWRDNRGSLAEWLSNGHGFNTSIIPNGDAAAAWHILSQPADFI